MFYFCASWWPWQSDIVGKGDELWSAPCNKFSHFMFLCPREQGILVGQAEKHEIYVPAHIRQIESKVFSIHVRTILFIM